MKLLSNSEKQDFLREPRSRMLKGSGKGLPSSSRYCGSKPFGSPGSFSGAGFGSGGGGSNSADFSPSSELLEDDDDDGSCLFSLEQETLPALLH